MFVYCFDDEGKDKLIKNGYKYVCTTIVSGVNAYVFEDNKKIQFSKDDKVYYTNKLYF